MARTYEVRMRALVTLPDGDVWVNATDLLVACYKGDWNEVADMVDTLREEVAKNPRRAVPARKSQWNPNEERKTAPPIAPPPRKKSWWQRITSD